MSSTQRTFEEILGLVAAEHGAELRTDFAFANRGTYTIARPGTFAPLLRIAFDWQQDQWGAKVTGSTTPALPGITADDGGSYWIAADALDRFVSAVRDFLEREDVL